MRETTWAILFHLEIKHMIFAKCKEIIWEIIFKFPSSNMILRKCIHVISAIRIGKMEFTRMQRKKHLMFIEAWVLPLWTYHGYLWCFQWDEVEEEKNQCDRHHIWNCIQALAHLFRFNKGNFNKCFSCLVGEFCGCKGDVLNEVAVGCLMLIRNGV